ncbi:MAG: glycosyltransferase family 2 protein [Gammaproteobacteria bacterium]|nr:MAG: glycosyltransferase family 2 protein [Gammaproteobacteria bacterium]
MERSDEPLCVSRDAAAGGSEPFVSVIAPCRREVRFVEAFVRSLQQQSYRCDRLEFLVADGMSDDGTREVLDRMALSDARLVVIDNPRRYVSAGLNLAIQRAKGDIVVRMDVHTVYAQDYVSRCVEALQSTGMGCVGGPWRAVGHGYWERAIAAGFRSPFGSGGARSHLEGYEGEVDSVYLGCWHRQRLIEYGMFDEDLVRNQDDELCLRIRRQGGHIWQSPKIRSEYRPRGSMLALGRQYYQYGYWKVRVIKKHGQAAAVRHFVPAAAIAIGAILAGLSVAVPVASTVLMWLAAAYAACVAGSSAVSCAADGDWALLPALPLVFATYHLGYGTGCWRGIIDFVLLAKTAPADHATRLSR